MKMKSPYIAVFLAVTFLASGCQTSTQTQTLEVAKASPKPKQTPRPGVKPAYSGLLASSKDYYAIAKQKQCVPHAREVSGIPIHGNAYTWWGQAEGKYVRNDMPQPGAVMVLSKTDRLKFGHLAVVKNVIDARTIEVEHTNWGGDLKSRCIVYEKMPVKDISPNNDWSTARFFNYPSQTFGSAYKVSGFIHPVAPTVPHDKIALSTQ